MNTEKQRYCDICSGPLIHMGKLGELIHYLCRNCGMWYNRRIKRRKKKSLLER
jgi:uncharacterized Zn finger protein